MDYLDYYNNRMINLKIKGLTPAQQRHQTLQAA
ncbi:MAG: IS3 family transposase [Acidaminococcaceae bacterium]|nr:IS3 family transposase [Acidaminococcaceae bacterium]